MKIYFLSFSETKFKSLFNIQIIEIKKKSSDIENITFIHDSFKFKTVSL